MEVPFPVEPVGVGARWTVTRNVAVPMRSQIVATYTLVEREGNHVVLESVSEVTGEPQPGPNGTRLTELDGGGEAPIEFDLTSLEPTMSLVSHSHMVLEAERGEQTAQIVNDMQMRISSSPH